MIVRLVSHPLRHHGALSRVTTIKPRSLLVTLVATTFINVIFAVRIAHRFVDFKTKATINKILTLALTQRLKPILATMVVTNQIKSTFTTRVNAVHIARRVSTLRILGASPVSCLIVPQVITYTLVLPLLGVLTFVANVANKLLVTADRCNVSICVFLSSTGGFLAI